MKKKKKDPEEYNPHLKDFAKKIITIVENYLSKKGEIVCTQDPTYDEKDIIEYNSRMRISGLEKFNEPCYITALCFYRNQFKLERSDAAGIFNIYFYEENIQKLFRALGKESFRDEDEERVFECIKEFSNDIFETLKSDFNEYGFTEIVAGDTKVAKSLIPEGINFPYSEYQMMEINFELWNKSTLIFEFTIEPTN